MKGVGCGGGGDDGIVVGGVLVGGGGDVDIGGVGRCEYFGSWDRLDRYLPRLDSTVFLVMIFFSFSFFFAYQLALLSNYCVYVCVFSLSFVTLGEFITHQHTHTHAHHPAR